MRIYRDDYGNNAYQTNTYVNGALSGPITVGSKGYRTNRMLMKKRRSFSGCSSCGGGFSGFGVGPFALLLGPVIGEGINAAVNWFSGWSWTGCRPGKEIPEGASPEGWVKDSNGVCQFIGKGPAAPPPGYYTAKAAAYPVKATATVVKTAAGDIVDSIPIIPKDFDWKSIGLIALVAVLIVKKL